MLMLKVLFKKTYIYIHTYRVAQACLTLCDPMDCSLQGCSVHGTFQARVLEWVAISFSSLSVSSHSNLLVLVGLLVIVPAAPAWISYSILLATVMDPRVSIEHKQPVSFCGETRRGSLSSSGAAELGHCESRAACVHLGELRPPTNDDLNSGPPLMMTCFSSLSDGRAFPHHLPLIKHCCQMSLWAGS